ncbi:MAG: YjbQ family protein [Peptococcaceae bacterium]|nr:YjbQ family protein [Peptococcaceae bacterium]
MIVGQWQPLQVKTHKRVELVDITALIQEMVKSSGIGDGVCFLYVPHTTAGITINESADPSVVRDIIAQLNKLVPYEDNYSHAEGNSDAHIKASLVGSSTFVPIAGGMLLLGTWQGIFFCEFDGPRTRKVLVKIKAD